ncbi:10290_t:CDS:2, partial [Dentiscutata heterogama]
MSLYSQIKSHNIQPSIKSRDMDRMLTEWFRNTEIGSDINRMNSEKKVRYLRSDATSLSDDNIQDIINTRNSMKRASEAMASKYKISTSKSTDSALEEDVVLDSKVKKTGERKSRTETVRVSDFISSTESSEDVLDLYKRTSSEIEKIRVSGRAL